jgi:hypothetical protein
MKTPVSPATQRRSPETHREKVRRLYAERKAVATEAAGEIAKREIARISELNPRRPDDKDDWSPL